MGKALYEDLVQGLTEAIAFEGGRRSSTYKNIFY